MKPLRLLIITRPELTRYNDVLFRRLIADPDFDVAGIVADEYPWRKWSWRERLSRWGPGYLPWKINQAVRAKIRNLFWQRWLRDHPVIDPGPSWQTLHDDTGVEVLRTDDVHGDQAVAWMREKAPALGVISGGRIIKAHVLSIPARGTLNIHKRKTPDYRGGGRVGYWELHNGEKEIGVTVHQAVEKVDEGAVLGQRIIPIEPYDTMASLEIKAGMAGTALYYEILKDLAAGRETVTRQDLSRGKTYRGAGEYFEQRLEAQRRKRLVQALARLGRAPDYFTSLPTWIKYLLAYRRLMAARQRLIESGQAPIVMLFYHTVGNDAGSSMTMPLEDFVGQVEFIRRHFPIISLAEAQRRLDSGNNNEMAFVLSFDDGYARDLETSLPWLKMMSIPCTWFVSVGHVIEGKPYAHDLKNGIEGQRPMTIEELRTVPCEVIDIGSHNYLHEDCGKLREEELPPAIVGSKIRLGEILGDPPEAYAFPKGIKCINITEASWKLAADTYTVVCSAYSGYNFPKDGSKHIKRWGAPSFPVSLMPIMDGFTGLADVKRGNLWTENTSGEKPY